MGRRPKTLRVRGGKTLCLLTLACGAADGMKGSMDVPLPPFDFLRYYDFGFDSGGLVDLHLELAGWPSAQSPPPPSAATQSLLPAAAAPPYDEFFVWAMVCSEDQTQALIASADDAPHLCRSANVSNVCTAAARLGGEGGANNTLWTLTRFQVPQSESYDFLILSCAPFGVNAAASWECVNPGGEQLPTGEIPLKTMTTGFGFTWVAMTCGAIVCGVWAALAYSVPPEWAAAALPLERQLKSAVRPLHYALVVPLLGMVASAFVSEKYWNELSVTGVDDPALSMVEAFVWDLAGSAAVAVLLALGRGWQVTRLRLEGYEVRHIVLLTAGYLCAQLSLQFVGGMFFLFFEVILYVLLVRFLFASVSWSLHLLQSFRVYTLGLARRIGGGDAGEGGAGGDEEGFGGAGAQRTESAEARERRQRRQAEEDEAASRMLLSSGQYAQHGWYGGVSATTATTTTTTTTPAAATATAGPQQPTQQYQQQYIAETEWGVATEYPVSSGYASLAAAQAASAGWGQGGMGAGRNPQRQRQREQAPSTWQRVSSFLGFSPDPVRSRSARGRGGSVYRPLGGVVVEEEEGGGGQWGMEGDGIPSADAAASSQGGTLFDGGLTERQIHALWFYRSAVVVYLTTRVFLDVWGSLEMDDGSPWVSYLLQQLLSLALLSYLVWVFRPRADPSTSLLYDPRGYVGTSAEGLLEEDGENGEGEGGRGGGGGGGRGGGRRQGRQGRHGHLIVVNPDSVDETGKIVGQVAIAEAQ